MPISFLDNIIAGAKKIAHQLKEKPKASVDVHILEHMVFYHGLTGTAPENEKDIGRVRADIKEAISEENSNALSLALKLAPTIWQNRLADICWQLTDEQRQSAIKLLTNGEHSSINHPDWQVKANAANILSWLDAKTAAPALAATLVGAPVNAPASIDPQDKLSFVYVAYALGKLQGEEAKNALEKHLKNDDAWLRVDAAGALAHFEFDSVAQSLAQALLDEQEALDYMSYAISRLYKPAQFLQSSQAKIIDAGCCLICGLIEAAHSSFSDDLILETESNKCLAQLEELAKNNGDPIIVDTMYELQNFVGADAIRPLYPRVDYIDPYTPFGRCIDPHNVGVRIVENLKLAIAGKAISAAELMHSIKLAGRLKIKEAQPLLCQLLEYTISGRINLAPTQINYTVSSLGEFADQNTSQVLVGFAERLVNLDERCQKPLSKQPVFEDEPEKAKTYWHILKALGMRADKSRPYDMLPSVPTEYPEIVFLFRALNDYAPDKRAQALESLMALHKNNAQITLPKPAQQFLQNALKDPSPIMQLAALAAIVDLNQSDLAMDIMPLIDAQENTVSKQALAAIACIYNNTNKQQEIESALQTKLKTIKEEHKLTAIRDILNGTGGKN